MMHTSCFGKNHGRIARKLTAGDVVLIAVLVCVTLLLGFLPYLKPAGETVMVRTPDMEACYTLDEDMTIPVTGNGYALIVRIQHGAVWVDTSNCRDGICKRTGRITRRGDSIVCAPAECIIKILGEGEDVDAVVG